MKGNLDQFIKYTNCFHENYFNFENKQVILYVEEESLSSPFMQQIRDLGVIVVNNLEDLRKAMFYGNR